MRCSPMTTGPGVLGATRRGLGGTCRSASIAIQIVGVVDRPFTGVEPGILTDVYSAGGDASLAAKLVRGSWHRILIAGTGVLREPLTRQLEAMHRRIRAGATKE